MSVVFVFLAVLEGECLTLCRNALVNAAHLIQMYQKFYFVPLPCGHGVAIARSDGMKCANDVLSCQFDMTIVRRTSFLRHLWGMKRTYQVWNGEKVCAGKDSEPCSGDTEDLSAIFPRREFFPRISDKFCTQLVLGKAIFLVPSDIFSHVILILTLVMS